MAKKAIIFDSSSIITLALNSLLEILPKLKEEFNVEFFITPQVKREVVEVPVKIKRFELEALMIEDLINHGIIALINPKGLEEETKNAIGLSNSAYSCAGDKIKLLHSGEASCFALQKLLPEYSVALVIDERTARIISEKPGNLRRLLEIKLHKPVEMDGKLLDYFKDARIMRSTELGIIAYKKGLLHIHAPRNKAVDAILYALKYKGCSISEDEIREAKILFKG